MSAVRNLAHEEFSTIASNDRLMFQAEPLSHAEIEEIERELRETARSEADIPREELQNYQQALAMIRSLNQAIADSYQSAEAGAAVTMLMKSVATLSATIQNYKGGAEATIELRNQAANLEKAVQNASNNSALDSTTRFMLRNSLQQLRKTNVSTPNIRNAVVHQLIRRATPNAVPQPANDIAAKSLPTSKATLQGKADIATDANPKGTTSPTQIAKGDVTARGDATTTARGEVTAESPRANSASTLTGAKASAADVASTARGTVGNQVSVAGASEGIVLAGAKATATALRADGTIAPVAPTAKSAALAATMAETGIRVEVRNTFRAAATTSTGITLSVVQGGLANDPQGNAAVATVTGARASLSVVAAPDKGPVASVSTVTTTIAPTVQPATPGATTISVSAPQAAQPAAVAPAVVTPNATTTNPVASQPAAATVAPTAPANAAPVTAQPNAQPVSAAPVAVAPATPVIAPTQATPAQITAAQTTPVQIAPAQIASAQPVAQQAAPAVPQAQAAPVLPTVHAPAQTVIQPTAVALIQAQPNQQQAFVGQQQQQIQQNNSNDHPQGHVVAQPQALQQQNPGDPGQSNQQPQIQEQNPQAFAPEQRAPEQRGNEQPTEVNREQKVADFKAAGCAACGACSDGKGCSTPTVSVSADAKAGLSTSYETASQPVSYATTSQMASIETRLETINAEITAFKETHGAGYKGAEGYQDLMERREVVLAEKRAENKNVNLPPRPPCAGGACASCHSCG